MENDQICTDEGAKDVNLKEVRAEQSDAGVPSAPPVSKKRAIIETLILCVALFFPLFLATLDTTIVATALPHIASSFKKLNDQSWIANAYILTNTAFLPAYGQVADIFGRHIVMQSAIFIFLVGSALCTAAQTWGMIIAGRAIAGVGAAGCFVMTRIIMSDTKSLRQNSTQTTYLSIMFAVAYSVGPVLGGVLTSVSWRWCFAINLPVCVLAHIIFFVLLRKRVRASTYDTEEEARPLSFKLKKVDYLGLTTFLASCICIILALVWGGSTYPWRSGRIIALLIIRSLLLAVFILIEWFFEKENTSRAPAFLRPIFIHGSPMIPLEVFKDWDVTICQWSNLSGGMVMYGQFYYIAIYFTIVFLYPPQEAGKQLLYFLPGLGVGAWSAIFFILKVFHGTRVILITGSVVMVVATGLFSMAVQNQSKIQLYVFMAMMGVGVGLTLMPTQLHSQARMMHYLAIVTSLVSFFRCLGGILALTLMSSVVNNKISSHFPSGQTSSSIDSLASIKSLPPALLTEVQDVFSNAIRWAYVALIPFVAIAAISSFFLREVKIERSSEEQARRQEESQKEDAELGKVPNNNGEVTRTHRPRIKVFGLVTGIIWCCQAIGDRMGWRK